MNKSVLKGIDVDNLLFNPLFPTIDYGCDYLTLSYKNDFPYLDKKLFSVDEDNSNFAIQDIEGKDFTFIRMHTSLGYSITFSYVYNGVSFPMFQYVKFNQQTRTFTKRKGKVSIYGSYFRLEEIGEFEQNFLINWLKMISLEDPSISRYDFRIDRFCKNQKIDIPEVEDICEYSNQSRVLVWRQGGKLIDWSVGSKDTDRYFIRYYDKKIDTDKKNKWILYSDFIKYKTVHRFEIEFLVQFCKGFFLSSLLELENKIYSVLGFNTKHFSTSLFYEYDSDCEITPDNAGKFIERYLNLSKKLLKAGYSPYQIIEESIIGTYGKDVALGLLEDFLDHSLVYRCSKVKTY